MMRRAILATLPWSLLGGKASVQTITFEKLWQNYPLGNPYPDPKGLFGDNQCAVRLSVALHRVGVDMRSFSPAVMAPAPGRRSLGVVEIGGLPVAIRADELAAWLQIHRPAGVGPAETVTGEDWRRRIGGRTGIVYFYDYMPRDGSHGFTGSHIDLWNGSRLTLPGGGNDYEVACSAFGLDRALPNGTFWCYDKGVARKILFWPVT
jgi:hypothetical protein